MLLQAASHLLRPLLFASAMAMCCSAQADTNDGTSVSWLLLHGDNSLTVKNGASYGSLLAVDNSHVAMTGGKVSNLRLQDHATAEISGGEISWLRPTGDSSLRITGLDKLSWLVLPEESDVHVDIFANDVSYISGRLRGTWANGKTFAFWAVTESKIDGTILLSMPSNVTITAVPEPSGIALFLAGVAAIAGLSSARGRRQAR